MEATAETRSRAATAHLSLELLPQPVLEPQQLRLLLLKPESNFVHVDLTKFAHAAMAQPTTRLRYERSAFVQEMVPCRACARLLASAHCSYARARAALSAQAVPAGTYLDLLQLTPLPLNPRLEVLRVRQCTHVGQCTSVPGV